MLTGQAVGGLQGGIPGPGGHGARGLTVVALVPLRPAGGRADQRSDPGARASGSCVGEDHVHSWQCRCARRSGSAVARHHPQVDGGPITRPGCTPVHDVRGAGLAVGGRSGRSRTRAVALTMAPSGRGMTRPVVMTRSGVVPISPGLVGGPPPPWAHRLGRRSPSRPRRTPLRRPGPPKNRSARPR